MKTRLIIVVLTLAVAVAPWLGSARLAEPVLANQPLSEYKARRVKLMEQIREGVIVLSGAFEADFGEVGRFRQNNYFQYLTGVETPDSYLILAPKGVDGAKELLFIPARNLAGERWTGPQLGPGAEAETTFGIEKVLPVSEFKKTLDRLAVNEKVFYSVIPRERDTTRTRETMLVQQLREMVATVTPSEPGGTSAKGEVRNVAAVINRMRQTKSEPELAMLQQAINATAVAHQSVARALRPGIHEYELEVEILGSFIRFGAERAIIPSEIRKRCNRSGGYRCGVYLRRGRHHSNLSVIGTIHAASARDLRPRARCAAPM
jgi:Xaa-Pro aminopeptidase